MRQHLIVEYFGIVLVSTGILQIRLFQIEINDILNSLNLIN